MVGEERKEDKKLFTHYVLRRKIFGKEKEEIHKLLTRLTGVLVGLQENASRAGTAVTGRVTQAEVRTGLAQLLTLRFHERAVGHLGHQFVAIHEANVDDVREAGEDAAWLADDQTLARLVVSRFRLLNVHRIDTSRFDVAPEDAALERR